MKSAGKEIFASIEHEKQEIEDIGKASGKFGFGIWSKKQQELYIVFLDFHRKEFKSRHLRRFGKIFKIMGQFVESRDAIQCRSHHMKQLRNFRNVDHVIRHYKRIVGDSTYSQLYESHKINLERFPIQSSLPKHHMKNKTTFTVMKIHAASQTEFESQNSQNPNLYLPKLYSSMPSMMLTPFQNWSWAGYQILPNYQVYGYTLMK